MAYNANLYNPYAPQQFQPSQNMSWQYQPSFTQPAQQQANQQAAPVIYVVPVKSVLEAKEYRENPGTEPPLFMLESDNVFIKKELDEQGGEKLRAFRFNEIPLDDIMPTEGGYVTKADFNEFANKVMEALNGKHAVEPAIEPQASA